MAEIFDSIRFTRRPKFLVWLVLGFALLVFLFVLSPFGTIAAGERGIHLRFNALTGKVFGEGLYFRVPFIESVQMLDVKIQKVETIAAAASKDLQTVHSTVALNFHIDPEQVSRIYQEVGLQYRERIIDPSMQEAIKGSTAKFTAEELITKREQVREDIKNQLRTKLKEHDILVDEFNIVNFEFSKIFNEAIEAKVTAEQQALAAKNKLEQIKFEADQKVAEAKGKAEAITIESNALRSNPQILELRALEKWNGVLPQVTSGATPFISIPK
jgi:prohibitin 2